MNAGVPVARSYAGPADLVAMQAALSTSWIVARPFSNTTVGDLEWWQVLAGPEDDWARQIRLWEVDGDVVAYAWFHAPGELDWHQRADLRPSIGAVIVDGALAWADGRAREATGPAGEHAPAALRTWAMDADARLGALLAARGFTAAPEPGYTQWYTRLADEPPTPILPPGYEIRNVRLPDDLEIRVEVHRAAFAPSRLTVAMYRALRSMPHYDPSRDLVAIAPDGSLAAFTLVWWDPIARMGEFEPVGTHPGHRGLGLARAVLHEGLRRLRELGAADAVVLSACDNVASEALYASAGFAAVTRHRAWTRALG
jgi:ribosomal protein S18 acetylase RimI-like enzyme